MTLTDLRDRSLLLIGFEATNRAFFRALKARHPDMRIAIADQNTSIDVPDGVTAHLGEDYLSALSEYDVIVRSPSVRYWPELLAVADRVTTATELFFAEVRANTAARIVGITGTKGKSTTATLIHQVLQQAGIPTLLVGNINTQDFDHLDMVADDTVIVYELSSYMLQDFTGRPDIAVWTNVYPDHLNWHENIESYAEAKSHITTHQTPEDVLIYNAYDRRVRPYAEQTAAQRLPINDTSHYHISGEQLMHGEQVLMPGERIALEGSHNWDNALMVFAVAEQLGIDTALVVATLESFTGLPHRLETVATHKNVRYIDDTLATNPDATIAAIETYEHVSCLILGGEDRGYDYTSLASHLVRRALAHVVLLPGCRDKLKQAFVAEGFQGELHEVETVEEAVAQAATVAEEQGVVLLSPAAPSYDQYRNYEEKALAFKEAAEALGA